MSRLLLGFRLPVFHTCWIQLLLLILVLNVEAERDVESDSKFAVVLSERPFPKPEGQPDPEYEDIGRNDGWRRRLAAHNADKLGQGTAAFHKRFYVKDEKAETEDFITRGEHRGYGKYNFIDEIPPRKETAVENIETQNGRNADWDTQIARYASKGYPIGNNNNMARQAYEEGDGPMEQPDMWLMGKQENGSIVDPLLKKTGDMDPPKLSKDGCPHRGTSCNTYYNTFLMAGNVDSKVVAAIQRAKELLTNRSKYATNRSIVYGDTLQKFTNAVKLFHQSVYHYIHQERVEHMRLAKNFWNEMNIGEKGKANGNPSKDGEDAERFLNTRSNNWKHLQDEADRFRVVKKFNVGGEGLTSDVPGLVKGINDLYMTNRGHDPTSPDKTSPYNTRYREGFYWKDKNAKFYHMDAAPDQSLGAGGSPLMPGGPAVSTRIQRVSPQPASSVVSPVAQPTEQSQTDFMRGWHSMTASLSKHFASS